MFPTLQTFTRALMTPDLSLRTLTDAHVVQGANGMPVLVRTTRFAEAEIEWHDAHWLLSMPLSPGAVAHTERTASELRRLHTEHLTEYRILPGELREGYDLILQRLPEGCTFAEALLTQPKERLLTALDLLEAGLQELHFTHNNLKAANLRWTQGRFVPIRYHDARIGSPQRDTEAFRALREAVVQAADVQSAHDTEVYYTAQRKLSGHHWVSHTFEGLICVEDPDGYGFVDTDNNPVIPAQFSWAGDFHEGRAEVQTATGMGLIDRQGCYVIAPEYEIVDYDPIESLVRVRRNGLWATFDYLGQQLTPFTTNIE